MDVNMGWIANIVETEVDQNFSDKPLEAVAFMRIDCRRVDRIKQFLSDMD